LVSNSEILEVEYNAQRTFPSEDEVVNHYSKVNKLFARPLSKEEERKTFEEKRKFMFGHAKRFSFFKADLILKMKDALSGKDYKRFEEMEKVLERFDDKENPMSSDEVLEVARKWDLRVKGELDKVEMIKKRDY